MDCFFKIIASFDETNIFRDTKPVNVMELKTIVCDYCEFIKGVL